MEKTLRKCGSTSGSSHSLNHLDINCLPFVIPKCYQITSNRLPAQDYHLDIHRFNYNFKVENAVIAEKAEREAALAAQQAAAEEAAAQEAAAVEAAKEIAGTESSDDCDVIADPHPTNPFLAVSGDVLIPTTAAVGNKPKGPDLLQQEIISSFDVQNSNPFDGTELQSLSNFDALRSVLAPSHVHDMALLEQTPGDDELQPPPYASVVDTLSPSSSVDNYYSPTVASEAAPPDPDPVYAPVNKDPIYSTVNKQPASTVNKAPAVIKSKKLGAVSSIEVINGGMGGMQIHNNYMAVSTPAPFLAAQAQPAPPQPAYTSYCPFPKIPEEVVARAMQRLDHNQEKCFEFLKEVLDVMTEHECSAEIAESISLLDFPEKKKVEAIVLIKQFAELGFSTDQIIAGLKQEPSDRDELLDYLTR